MSETKTADSLMPDLAAPVRKRRAPKHDFKDGNGPVFAHRHDNGGGWVADTAWVAPSAHVTRNAQVYNHARVHDLCEILGRARVSGRARLFGNCVVLQDATVTGNATLFNRCNLRGWTRVEGEAVLSGTTWCEGRVVIYSSARVHSTRCIGPRANSTSTVSGCAQLVNSTLSENFNVMDSVLCANAQLCNVTARQSARVINSTLRCRRHWAYWTHINGRATTQPTLPPRPPELAVIDFSGTAIGSDLFFEPLTVNDFVLFAGSTIHIADDVADAGVFTPGDQGLRFVNIAVDGRGALERHLGQSSAAVPVVTTTVQAPNFDAVRQRRVMRLEDNS